MNKELANYKENLFSKLKKFFIKFILNKENKKAENKQPENKTIKKKFYENIMVDQNRPESSLEKLKRLYDNREIDEANISDEDINKLIEMYDREIETLRDDTERRRKNIAFMLHNMISKNNKKYLTNNNKNDEILS